MRPNPNESIDSFIMRTLEELPPGTEFTARSLSSTVKDANRGWNITPRIISIVIHKADFIEVIGREHRGMVYRVKEEAVA